MISLEWMFYFFIIFFTLIGALRGWQREVIALSGLIGSIAALNAFGFVFIPPAVDFLEIFAPLDPEVANAAAKRQFWAQFIFHCMIAFFSYQVISRIADRSGGRFGDRLRMSFQRRFIGGFIGAINGYLLIGGLWGFLEYQLTALGYQRIPFGQAYIFSADIVTRPPFGVDPTFDIGSWLPFGVAGTNVWLLFFFLAFFVVIIALI